MRNVTSFYTARRGVLLDSSAIISALIDGAPRACTSVPTVVNYLQDYGMKGLVTPQILSEVKANLEKKYNGCHIDNFGTMVDGCLFVEKVPMSYVKTTLPTVEEMYKEARKKFSAFTQKTIGRRGKKKGAKAMKLKKDPGYKYLHTKLFEKPPEYMDKLIIAQAAFLKEKKYEELFIASKDTHLSPIRANTKLFSRLIPDAIQKQFGVICEHPIVLGDAFYEEEKKSRRR